MKAYLLLNCLLIVFGFECFTQEIVFGTNNYIEYQIGNLPVIISVPHGGALSPDLIPDRGCNNPEYATDANTIETAQEMRDALFKATGCFPHIIICHLKRSKLDCNRNVTDGTCNNSDAVTAWNEFHDFIEEAQEAANKQYNNKTYFVDLHGHGNPLQRIELGYMLYDYELEQSDQKLNEAGFITLSSIQNLVGTNLNQYTHAQLLRGEYSLGTLLTNNGFPSVPSQQIPFPGTSSNYFSGGYITANHTCFNKNKITNGVQMELNYKGVRDNPSNRALFGAQFSAAIMEYLSKHAMVPWLNCSATSTGNIPSSTVRISHIPSSSGSRILISLPVTGNWHYEVFNVSGQLLEGKKIDNVDEIEPVNGLLPGLYLLYVCDENSNISHKIKFNVR